MDTSSGYCSSPRLERFPAGLRVLVVDDDPTWLKILEKMLKKCNYEVTTCNLARDALHLLRERKDGFDIVISDVNMPDMDGFKLLEHVGLEMDLPVIMMSVDGETSRVMKGVQHGACDYLLKPIRMKELKNIWQHVLRKRINEVRDIEGLEGFDDEVHIFGNGNEHVEDGYLFSGDTILGKKRKDMDNNKHDERMCGDTSSGKKSRVVWTVDLHQKFVKAVNQIGFDKVGPKKILDLMGVSWLTRENVASHLQKYRLYLSRLQKENELKTGFCGMKQLDFPPKDPFANTCFTSSPNSISLQQKIGTKESYRASAHKDDSRISEESAKGVFPSLPMTEFKNSRFGDVIDPPKTSTTRISFGHSYGTVDSGVRPKIQTQYQWTIESPSIQFKQERKSNVSREKTNKVESTSSLFSAQPQPHLSDSHAYDKIPCTKNQGLEHNLYDDLESSQKSFILGNASASKFSDDGWDCFSTQGEFLPQSINLGNIESFGRINQDPIIDIPTQLYDNLSFDYVIDPVEYHAIDQGVYIA